MEGEQTLDQQLEALFSETAAPAAAPEEGGSQQPASDTQQPAATSPPAAKPEDAKPAETPATPEEDPLLKALEGIEDGEKPKDGEQQSKPQLSEEQSQILQIVPNVEAAQTLATVAQNYSNFANAFEQGRHEEVEKMFENWNKPAYEAFLEHVYEKKVASGEWVDRFIDEKESGKRQSGQVRALQQQINDMRQQLNQRSQSEQQAQEQARQRQTFAAYNQHVNGLFEKINFAEADRPWIMAKLNTAVAADPKLLSDLKSGNVNAVNKLFKETVKTYVTRDKQNTTAVKAKIDEQSKRMPLLGGSAPQEQQALPDDINQVPKGKEDDWMDQQFAKLKRFVKR